MLLRGLARKSELQSSDRASFRMKLIELSPLELDPRHSVRREMPRPPDLRAADYEEKFDDLTIFYDCFRSADGADWVFVGPPLFNLQPVVASVLKRLVHPAPSIDEDLSSLTRGDNRLNLSLLWLRTSASNIDLSGAVFRQRRLSVQPNHADLFHGRRVLLTQSKNNELAWIHDWAYFFARHHGCNAVLVYDNASTKYDTLAVHDAIASVPGIEVAVVVHWPFKYGPTGSERDLGLQGIPWDSNFLQLGMLEHARHRFLSSAEAVANADIDELVLTSDKNSVFDLAGRSKSGYLQYRGFWIESATNSVKKGVRRHVDFYYRSKAPSDSLLWKWTVAPDRCGPQARWLPHEIVGMKPDTVSRLVSYRHFRAISTGWKYSRGATQCPNKLEHFKDDELVVWMQIFNQSERISASLARAIARYGRRIGTITRRLFLSMCRAGPTA